MMPTNPVLAQRPVFTWEATLLGNYRLVQTGGTTVLLPEIAVPQTTGSAYLTAFRDQISLAYYYGTDFAEQLISYAQTGVDFRIVVLNNRNYLTYGQDGPGNNPGAHIDPREYSYDLGSPRAVREKIFGPDFTIYFNGETLNTQSPSFSSLVGFFLAHEGTSPKSHHHREIHSQGVNVDWQDVLADPAEGASINFLYNTGQAVNVDGFVVSPAGKTYAQFAREVADIRVLSYKARALNQLKYPGSSSNIGAPSLTEADLQQIWWYEFAGGLGGTMGSALGSYLADGDRARGVVYSSLLGEIGERLASSLTLGGDAATFMRSATAGGLAQFGSEVAVRAGQAAIGSVGSWLSLELGEALGLEGFGAELFTTVGGTVTSRVIGNLLNSTLGPSKIWNGFVMQSSASPAGAAMPLNAAIGGAIGAFLGAKLGSMVVNPQTQAAVALSSIGSAAGAYIAYQTIGGWATSKFGSVLGNAIAPGIGAFVGFILGALIGNLFGRRKPKIPTANASTYLDFTTDQFELGSATAVNGGNLNLVKAMAASGKDALNGFLAVMKGEFASDTTPGYGWYSSYGGTYVYTITPTVTFGHTGGQIWVTTNAGQVNVTSADQAVEKGVLYGLSQTFVVGGDILVKRAVSSFTARGGTDITALLGDLQIASDYRFYSSNRELINGFITSAYQSLTAAQQSYYGTQKALVDKLHLNGEGGLTSSELGVYTANKATIDKIIAALEAQTVANPWIITLQRVTELGLDKFWTSDFHGGLQGFLMSFDLAGHRAYFEDVALSQTGSDLRIALPNGSEAGLFATLPQASTDGRSINVTDFFTAASGGLNSVGYHYNATAVSTGDDFINRSTATTVVALADTGGDDIFLGGSAADQLQGGLGWDWLSGAGGGDTLRGGAGNDIVLGGEGADYLYGDADIDYLAGGAGNDSLYGGAGADTLIGGAGVDILSGDDGDDVLVVDQSDGAADTLSGGGGVDSLSFERWTQGVTFTLGSGVAFGDTYTSIEGVVGSRHADVLTGDGLANRLSGGHGNDTLSGGNGDDILNGGQGADILVGGGGVDTVSYETSAHSVFVDLGLAKGARGDAAGDTYSSIENLRGSEGSDELIGNATANRIEGQGGDDWLVATAGADVYKGGEGFDTLDYSRGFAAGESTYQQWVEEGYLDLTTLEWISTGGHYETVTSFMSGISVFSANGTLTARSSDGTVNTHQIEGIEHIIGTETSDFIFLGIGDQFYTGGKGNDTLNGGYGNDTYFFSSGDGNDVIMDDFNLFDTDQTNDVEDNTISFTSEVGFNSLAFSYTPADQANQIYENFFSIHYGVSDSIKMNGSIVDSINKIRVIDMNGLSQLDMSPVQRLAAGGTASANTINGVAGSGDLIAGYGGNDVLRGSGSSWESAGNVIIGGAGNDTITTSAGDDQFGFERGSGRDTVTDAGGEDTIVFGPNVAAHDVIYKVVGNDLYVGIAEGGNPTYGANQVTDYVRVVSGAIRYQNVSTGAQSYAGVEFVNAGGTWIDLRKLNIPWVTSYTSGTAPIVFDLQGDGLDLVGVDQSSVVSKLETGFLARTSWVDATDGFLAVDRDGDGQINRTSEISFIGDKAGAMTDLEGLSAWDTNSDGKISVLDEGWSQLKLWVDVNQNGRSTAGELKTLDEAGILEINLSGRSTGASYETSGGESFVHNTLSFTWASGETGQAYDVELGRKLVGAEGMSLEALRAAWGDPATDAELGRLISEWAQTAEPSLRKRPQVGTNSETNLLEKVDLRENDLQRVGSARADFSDHDRTFTEDLARQLERFGKSSETVEVDSDLLASLKLLTDGLGGGSRFERPDWSMQEETTLGDDGYAISSDLLAASAATASSPRIMEVASGSPALSVERGSWSQLDQSAARLQAGEGTTLDPWTAAPITLAEGRVGPRWWAQAVPSLPIPSSLSAAIGSGEAFAGRIEVAEIDPAMLSAHQKLTQALAAFGPRSGAGAAVWTRSGDLAYAGTPAVDPRTSRWTLNHPARMST